MFCNKCGRWNSGGSHNSSYNHNTKEETSKLKSFPSHIVATNYENHQGGKGLHLMEILFLGICAENSSYLG